VVYENYENYTWRVAAFLQGMLKDPRSAPGNVALRYKTQTLNIK